MVLTGLQKLLTLSLDRSPAADVVRGMAMTWVEALTAGKCWFETRDRPRFEAAFRTLALQARRWPAPAELLDCLPGGDERQISGPRERPVDPPYLRDAMAKVEREREQQS